MAFFPVFLSVVFVVRNQANALEPLLTEATTAIESLVSDYELIVVDNASIDESVVSLKNLTTGSALANIQVYALTKEVDFDTAAWVGLESALGDFVAVIDPTTDDIKFLPAMLEYAVRGTDVVFAMNKQKLRQGIIYRICHSLFNALYEWFNDVHLATEAPQYRILSRRVINFILQHSTPPITYRHLPATGGFLRENLSYSAPPKAPQPKRLSDGINRGMRLLVSTTKGPMRLVTSLSLFGAVSNLIYSLYVIAVALFKSDVAPGWVTLSLQQSGMFFLLSLVLLVLGEYILHMASLSNEGPLYHVGQEFTSTRMTRREKLNIEQPHTSSLSSHGSPVERIG